MKRVLLFLATNIAVILVLSIVLQLVGFQGLLDERGVDLNYEALLLFAAVFGMGGSFISLAMSKWMARRMTGAQVIAEPRSQAEMWLVETVRQQADAAGIGMPEVAVFESPDPNAFATGARKDHALVAVSTGLLASMNRDEVEAVLAHEMSHVANGDMITLALIQGVVNTFVIFLARVIGHVVDRVVLKNERGYGIGYFVSVIAAQIALGILASIVVMWFSRQREFRADSGGARLAGAPKMIAALERLKAGPQEDLPEQLAAFGISGGVRTGLRRLMSTHPSLDERIDRLKAESGMAA
ncbi:MAG: protease HtpX [Deltaproteobacteria bacterium]|jgi:heat shock protein HtpX|nr:protease HtpX [Deltaproteobacteria bacterium]